MRLALTLNPAQAAKFQRFYDDVRRESRAQGVPLQSMPIVAANLIMEGLESLGFESEPCDCEHCRGGPRGEAWDASDDVAPIDTHLPPEVPPFKVDL
jgi:hypothetical protein